VNPRDRISRYIALLEEHGINEHDEAIEWLAEEIPDSEFQPRWVEDVDLATHRWYEVVLSVYEIDKDIFIGIEWHSGHTENQENSWPNGKIYMLNRKAITTYDYEYDDVAGAVEPINNY
jgi:hypothetical protein